MHTKSVILNVLIHLISKLNAVGGLKKSSCSSSFLSYTNIVERVVKESSRYAYLTIGSRNCTGLHDTIESLIKNVFFHSAILIKVGHCW